MHHRTRFRERLVGLAAACVLVASGTIQAQPAQGESKGYVEGVAQSTFGNVTSQSFGVEAGFDIGQGLAIFVEVGHARDTAPSSVGADAQLIAGFLAQTQSGVSYGVKQPMTFGVGGIRYAVRTANPAMRPYVMGGAGAAHVDKNVTFSIGGSDITTDIQQYGVVLGSDLAGSETKPMISVGGGVVWSAWRQLVLDFQYRYGHVFTSEESLNVNRAGIGAGVRF
jgi:opacity protein-like surface antigen